MTKQRLIRLLPVFLLLATIAYSAWGIHMADVRREDAVEAGRVVEVLILPGAGARDVAAEFQRLGVVADTKDLVRWMARLKIDRTIKPGLYRIEAGRAKDVAKRLAEAKPSVVEARILPGALFSEVAAELKREDGETVLRAALEADGNFPVQLRPLLPHGAEHRLVFLAPETYQLPPGDGAPADLVKKSSETWWKLHGTNIPKGMTSADLAAEGVLASIVQKEALLDAERPTIAGVFKNRLKKDMPLQSCATVVHAWRLKDVKITTVSYNDVKVDSPFNTYIHKGLPPANIGVPAASSWQAVLSPEKTDKLFFVARGDGSHVFTRTYDEHLAAQRKIRRGEL